MVKLTTKENDDPLFIELVSRILNGAIRCYKPTEIYIVQIDNWFDHRWRAFSGKSVGAVGVWNSVLTVPPFEPNRVVNQLYYRAEKSNPDVYLLQPSQPLHLHQWSGSNLQRFPKQITESGLFAWYNSGTKNNGVGSLMAYDLGKDVESSWYISFSKDREWKINKVQNISKQEISGMMKLSDAANSI